MKRTKKKRKRKEGRKHEGGKWTCKFLTATRDCANKQFLKEHVKMTLIKGVRGEDYRGEFLRETFFKKRKKEKEKPSSSPPVFPRWHTSPSLSLSPSLISLTKFLCAITTLIIIIIVTTLRCYRAHFHIAATI